jgi:hypothetical protein
MWPGTILKLTSLKSLQRHWPPCGQDAVISRLPHAGTSPSHVFYKQLCEPMIERPDLLQYLSLAAVV